MLERGPAFTAPGEAAAAATFPDDESVGPCRLLRLIARGSTGEVSLAKRSHSQLKRQVALALPMRACAVMRKPSARRSRAAERCCCSGRGPRVRFLSRTAYFRVEGTARCPEPGELTMKPNAIQQRLARLQRECHVSAGPALLLSAACAVLVLVLVMNAALSDAVPAQAVTPTPQIAPPAA